MKDEIRQLLIDQIRLEAQSSAAYLAMAAWCDEKGFENSADFFYTQSDEERAHMLKIFKYMGDVGAKPVSPEVSRTNHDFGSLREVFEKALESEETVTAAVNNIMSECRNHNDFATEQFFKWFVTEQVEEEYVARRALELLDILINDPGGLLLFDERVSKIAYTSDSGQN